MTGEQKAFGGLRSALNAPYELRASNCFAGDCRRRSGLEVSRRVHSLVKHPHNLHVVAAVTKHDKMDALVSAEKARAKVVARLPQL